MKQSQPIASTNIITGQQYFHPDYYRLQPHVQHLVYLHEKAHLQLRTTSEKAVWKHSVPQYLERYSQEQLQDAINQLQIWHKGPWANFITVASAIGLALSGTSFGVGLWQKNKAENAQRKARQAAEAARIDYTLDQNQAAYQQAIDQAVQKEKLSTTVTYIGGAMALITIVYLIYKYFMKS